MEKLEVDYQVNYNLIVHFEPLNKQILKFEELISKIECFLKNYSVLKEIFDENENAENELTNSQKYKLNSLEISLKEALLRKERGSLLSRHEEWLKCIKSIENKFSKIKNRVGIADKALDIESKFEKWKGVLSKLKKDESLTNLTAKNLKKQIRDVMGKKSRSANNYIPIMYSLPSNYIEKRFY